MADQKTNQEKPKESNSSEPTAGDSSSSEEVVSTEECGHPADSGSAGSAPAPTEDYLPPLRVTRIAAEKVREIAAGEGIADFRLRVKVIGGGCAGFAYDLAFDEKTQEEGEEKKLVPCGSNDPVSEFDVLIEAEGVHFIIDQMSLMYMRGTKIDYVETLQGTGFKFDNPQTSSQCGCGQSFAV